MFEKKLINEWKVIDFSILPSCQSVTTSYMTFTFSSKNLEMVIKLNLFSKYHLERIDLKWWHSLSWYEIVPDDVKQILFGKRFDKEEFDIKEDLRDYSDDEAGEN